MQVVYPTEVLRLMGLRRSYLFASMQRTLTSTYVGLQCLPLLDFTLCFELLTSSLLVFQVSQFNKKVVPMVNLQMAFLLIKAGRAELCFVVLL